MRPASSSKSRCIRAYSGTSERDFGVICSIVTRARAACGERSRKVANAAMRCFKPLDLRHGDAEEPVAAAIFVRIVDARDGGDADQKKIQHHAGRQFRWPVVGADWHHLSEATASRDRTR